MTTQPTPERQEVAGPERACGACGHGEDEHLEQEVEVAGDTLRRTFCAGCEDWHDFVPEPG